jgi:low temperature requirement protein LtrA
MESGSTAARHRISAAMREAERVMPLELFFDLVFVLALTQCTALMVDHPHWDGLGQSVVVLLLLWWAWTGYAWLTSVIDPEDGPARLVLVAAMAGLLVAALAVPEAFGGRAVEFVLAYAAVRVAHIGLFLVASREDAQLRLSITGFAGSTAVAVALLLAGAIIGGTGQAVLWLAAIILDLGWAFLFRSSGWRLVPEHFAERHGLIVIVALGESIVALGVGADVAFSLSVVGAAILGVALVFEYWWIYFDVVAIANVRRLVRAQAGRVQNEMARDVYSYLHFPLVAGIELSAFALHEALRHPDEPLHSVPAFALLGGIAIYLLGHVAIRLRGAGTWNIQRCVVAALMLALLALAPHVSAIAVLAIAVGVLAAMITYETRVYGPGRARIRRDFAVEGPMAEWPIDRTGERAR